VRAVCSGCSLPLPLRPSTAASSPFPLHAAQPGLRARSPKHARQRAVFAFAFTYIDTDLDALLSAYVDGGGTALVRPHCGELGGVEEGELRRGFEMGTRESTADLFLNADTVVSY